VRTLRVSVLGLGVGYSLACCLAEAGYKTVGIDIDPEAVASPRADPSTDKLLKGKAIRNRIERNLRLTTSYQVIRNCGYIIVCVSTGDEKKLVLGNVEDAVRQTLRVLSEARRKTVPILMVYSTLPFASSRKVRKIFADEKVEMDNEVGYVHFPLMIAQGSAAEDFVNPPFVVFGSYNLRSAQRALSFYKQFIKRSCLYAGKMPPMFVGTPEEAELAKLSANAYLTTKIALANEIGSLCERLNVDGQKIMEIVGSDWRIGRKFTRPGYAVGGQCFPRDLRSLIETFQRSRVEPRILASVNESNEKRVVEPLDKIEGKRVLVLGISYKESVKNTQGSQALKLVGHLRRQGYSVNTFDPKFSGSSKLPCDIGAYDTVIVTIPERGFRNIGRSLKGEFKVLLDFANIVDAKGLPPQVRFWRAGQGWVRSLET